MFKYLQKKLGLDHKALRNEMNVEWRRMIRYLLKGHKNIGVYQHLKDFFDKYARAFHYDDAQKQTFIIEHMNKLMPWYQRDTGSTFLYFVEKEKDYNRSKFSEMLRFYFDAMIKTGVKHPFSLYTLEGKKSYPESVCSWELFLGVVKFIEYAKEEQLDKYSEYLLSCLYFHNDVTNFLMRITRMHSVKLFDNIKTIFEKNGLSRDFLKICQLIKNHELHPWASETYQSWEEKTLSLPGAGVGAVTFQASGDEKPSPLKRRSNFSLSRMGESAPQS